MPAMSRRVGISRYGKRPPLLKTLNRPETDGQPSIWSSNASLDLAPSDDKQCSDQDENFIFAEPVSSDEEEVSHGCVSYSSDEEDIGRGDIRPTNFKAMDDMCNGRTHTPTDSDGFGPIRDNFSAGRSMSHTKSPPRRSKRNCNESGNSTFKKAKLEMSAVHTPKELDMFNTKSTNTRVRSIRTYGSQSRSQGSRGSQSNGESSPGAVFKKSMQGTVNALQLSSELVLTLSHK